MTSTVIFNLLLMRAARLLRLLLVLQNRGRQTTAQLAEELEVSRRTILRDVDAMTEAGLPIIVFQGNQGGIELGFQYRTRLTGLTQEEATALGLVLSAQNPMIEALELYPEAELAKTKLVESFPDQTRHHVETAMAQFKLTSASPSDDPRIAAIARAIQQSSIVTLRFASDTAQVVHPTRLELAEDTWRLWDAQTEIWIDAKDWGRVNISRRRFQVERPSR